MKKQQRRMLERKIATRIKGEIGRAVKRSEDCPDEIISVVASPLDVVSDFVAVAFTHYVRGWHDAKTET